MRPHHWKVLGDLLLQVRVVRLFQKVIEVMNMNDKLDAFGNFGA